MSKLLKVCLHKGCVCPVVRTAVRTECNKSIFKTTKKKNSKGNCLKIKINLDVVVRQNRNLIWKKNVFTTAFGYCILDTSSLVILFVKILSFFHWHGKVISTYSLPLASQLLKRHPLRILTSPMNMDGCTDEAWFLSALNSAAKA